MRDFKVAAAFGIGLLMASGATLAQSYGRGRNVQFVDGATISPTSVQASGTGDQFMCTATTAVCEVESNISAATMTSTVPAFDIGPTATPGANDRLACFSYGPSGSKTRMMCVDAEGDVTPAGDVVLTNPKRLCLNAACTANIKANATFADQLEITTASGNRMEINGAGTVSIPGLLFSASSGVTGSFNSSTASGNNAYTCTNVGCRLSLGNTGRYFVDNGSVVEYVGSVLQASSFQGNLTTGGTTEVRGSSGTTGVSIRAANAASTTIANFVHDTTTRASVDSSGNYSGNGFVATTASGSALTGGGASGSLLLTSNATDAATSLTVPAIRLRASQDIASTDLLFSVEDSANNIRFRVAEDGAATISNVLSRYWTGVGVPLEMNTFVGTTESNPLRFIAHSNYTSDTANIVSIYNNGSTQVATFSKDGLLRVNKSNAAKPTCNADNRGRIYFADGVTGGGATADVFEVCGKSAADVYSWKSIVTW